MDQFDWVKARAECCMFNVFVKMKAEIEADIETRMEQLKGYARLIKLVPTGAESFAVTLTGNGLTSRSVSFAKVGETIVIRDGDVSTVASLTLNDAGECRLKVGDLERDSWQIRRTALGGLFFDGL